MENCRSCMHWKPLFSGEAWGVRSFVDAPAEARDRIKQTLQAALSGGKDIYEAVENMHELPADAEMGLGSIPGGIDWPDWGECSLTDIACEKKSLARAIDGSEYMAVLRCHADFGCVQWVAYP